MKIHRKVVLSSNVRVIIRLPYVEMGEPFTETRFRPGEGAFFSVAVDLTILTSAPLSTKNNSPDFRSHIWKSLLQLELIAVVAVSLTQRLSSFPDAIYKGEHIYELFDRNVDGNNRILWENCSMWDCNF